MKLQSWRRAAAMLCLTFACGLCAAAAGAVAAPPGAASAAAAAVEAELVIAHRPVARLRAHFAGADPQARVARAQLRVREVLERGLGHEVQRAALTAEGTRGVAMRVGDVVVFTLVEADLDPGEQRSLDQAAQQAAGELSQALQAQHEQRRWPVLFKGLLVALGATLLFGVALWLLWALTRWLSRRMATAQAEAEHGSALRRYCAALVARLLQVAALVVAAALTVAWLEVVLSAFPATRALAQQLRSMLASAAELVASGIVDAVPGLFVVAVIVLVSQGVVEASNAMFRAVAQGRMTVPFVHQDTAGASRQLVVIAIRALAVVAAYPYLPGSHSAVFQGVSVLIGAMITLGSSGVVQQAMSGLVLVYSRALKVGEYVVIGDPAQQIEGAVVEVGALATKITAVTGDVITVPNAVLVGNPVRNYSRQPGQGSQVSTSVTIGYDAPWRLVHKLLLEAAAATPGLRTSPEPFVLQRALNDFYVAYELRAYTDRPIERLVVLSQLHGRIQDMFNAQGVQIMSPHFLDQPADPVVVPPAKWDPPLQRGAAE